MIVCTDCRAELAAETDSCAKCGWAPIIRMGLADRLRSADRADAGLASYIETYDTLAERNQANPVESNRYVENLSVRFAEAIGEVGGKDVCDVGSGRGYLIRHLLKGKPRSVTAIDIAAPSLREVVRNYGVTGMLANAEHLPFERHFDVLAATDIIEHVLNVSNFLVTANWSLRDGGMLAARVPYLENFLCYSNYHGLPMHYTHIRTFDRRTFVELVESFGFKVRQVMYDGFNPHYPRPWLEKLPDVRKRVNDYVKKRFGEYDEVTKIEPWLGRILFKPIEIGVIATKEVHLEPVDAHASLRAFHEQRRTAARAAG